MCARIAASISLNGIMVTNSVSQSVPYVGRELLGYAAKQPELEEKLFQATGDCGSYHESCSLSFFDYVQNDVVSV